jgi:hypothetical protein
MMSKLPTYLQQNTDNYGNTSTNLAIIKVPTRQFKNNPTLLFGAESNISGTIVFQKGGAALIDRTLL